MQKPIKNYVYSKNLEETEALATSLVQLPIVTATQAITNIVSNEIPSDELEKL